MKKSFAILLSLTCLMVMPSKMKATKYLGTKIIDKNYIMLHFRDGEVRYQDDGTGPSAFLGHAGGPDTLLVYGERLDIEALVNKGDWTISSNDDNAFGSVNPLAVYRKTKPMNTDHTLSSELDHWIFLQLPKDMIQGKTYTVNIPATINSDQSEGSVKFDIYNSISEAVHVNIIGYSPSSPKHAADLYLWLGDGGQRDYKSFEGKRVYLYNVNTKKSQQVGKVNFWMSKKEAENEANKKDNTGSDVWNIDFKCTTPGRYRLCVEGVGCSMDFDIKNDVYYEPYHYSVRGYYYMRLGEKPNPNISPVPRQPAFIPEEDPIGFTVYKTDFHPFCTEWRELGGDVWDEPHFKPALSSIFWKHRLPGNPVNTEVKGGHSDAFDWDRHLAHVSNIYDMLLPYILTNGRLNEDDLGITESGNGIPDIIDEARNEVDFFLSIRDGEGYSQGVTNPSIEHSVMFQAGCTTMAAWANAANCAMLAEAMRIAGQDSLMNYYKDEAITAYSYALRQDDALSEYPQLIGDGFMQMRDFRHQASAFLYNVTGERKWEDEMQRNTSVFTPSSFIWTPGWGGYQVWGSAAYLSCPHEIHYPELLELMKQVINRQADELHINRSTACPSRRTTNDSRWATSENLNLLILAHYIATDKKRIAEVEKSMYIDADWCFGRNPSNLVEMTGLGERHIASCYTTGQNDGIPEVHPGHTPFNGTEVWSKGNGGDATILLNRCYPEWDEFWPKQESYFNQRYLWVNGEFTPRETMRGKMALTGYLYGIRK